MRLAAFDVETGGVEREYALQPFRSTAGQMARHRRRQAWVTSYALAMRRPDGSIATGGRTWPQRDHLQQVLTELADGGYYVTAWNAPFDVAWLIAMGLMETVLRIKWLDGMLLYKHLTSSPRYLPADETPAPKFYGLKEAVARFRPEHAGYEDGIDYADQTFGGLEKLLTYNKLDTRFTLEFTEMMWAWLTPEQQRAALIEARCIPLIADSMVRGITTDVEKASALSNKLTDDAKLAFVSLKVSDGQGVTEEALASPKQLAELLFDKWGLPVVKMTAPSTTHPAGQRATDKEALGELAELDPRAKMVRDYREARNNRTKFADAVVTSTAYNDDGCTRPNPRVFGTYTGRLTYSSKQGKGKAELPTGIALHQWKRGKDFRRLLRAPEGYTLLEHDFAGQEFKWMAVESMDPTMLGLCEPGEDPHSYMTGRIESRDYRELMRLVAAEQEEAKRLRQLGKVANLSLQYRTGYKRLRIVARTQYDVRISEPQAKAIHATYRTTYPGVVLYWARQIALGKKQGWVETQAGRRVQLGDPAGRDPLKDWAYDSTAINFPIQGVGGDQKYLALAVLRDYLPKVDGHFYYELHDGMFSIVPDQYAERAADEIRALLSNLPYKQAWGKVFPIQFPVDAKLGKSWGDLKDFH